LRFTALTIALAAASSFAVRSYAQEPYQWKPAVVANRAAAPAPAPDYLPTEADATGAWQPAGVVATPASYGVHPAAYASIGEDYAALPDMSGGCSCGGTACGGCGGGGLLCDRFPVYGLWGSVEYMFAWTKGRSVPALVTTDPI